MKITKDKRATWSVHNRLKDKNLHEKRSVSLFGTASAQNELTSGPSEPYAEDVPRTYPAGGPRP